MYIFRHLKRAGSAVVSVQKAYSTGKRIIQEKENTKYNYKFFNKNRSGVKNQ
jgi:hypothetical protein